MSQPTDARRRGSIRQRGSSLQVRLFAGKDPVTGRDVYLTASIQGTDKKAWKKAEDKLSEFRAQVNKQRFTPSSVSLGHAIDEWMRVSEHEETTAHGYRGYIERMIRPALGKEPLNKVSARMLESFYAELRRCRALCDRRPAIEHKVTGEHDCMKSKCKPHECKPLAASTVRQIHAILSGTLGAAERWDWIDSNPCRNVKRPKQKPPEPDPPSPKEAARLVEKAFKLDDDWGTLVWLVMTTGIRRGEACALHFTDLQIDWEDTAGDSDGILEVRRNYVRRAGISKEKATKTHQMRRIALDGETVTLLREHRERAKKRVEALGRKFRDDLFVFSGSQTPDHTEPYSPNAVTQRYKDMAARLGIDTHIHSLRHYSATELLTAGVDLRTVAGRLGHGGGGSTTLRVYAAWVAASDRKAAEILASRMPKRGGPRKNDPT